LPFGEARILIADIESNLRFAGQYFDAETGLHYNWHRYYDPLTDRYLTPDPTALTAGLIFTGMSAEIRGVVIRGVVTASDIADSCPKLGI